MKKTLLSLIVLPVLLTACSGFLRPAQPSVAGLVKGTPPKMGAVRIGSVGASFGGIASSTSGQINVPLKQGTSGYVANLPVFEKSGAVDLFAYVDVNNNGSFDLLEPRTAGRTLVFVAKGAPALGELQQGWNLIKGVGVEKSGTHFTGVDLSW